MVGLIPAILAAFLASAAVKDALQARDYARAESLLVQEFSAKPDSAQLLTMLGGVQFQARRFERAAAAFEKANRIQPLDDANRFTLAMAYAALNQRDRASEHLRKLPETAITAYWQGRLAFASADYRRAIPLFERAIRLDGGLARAYDSLGLAHEASGNTTEAIKYYRLAAAKNAKCSPWPAHNLGSLLVKVDRLAEAETAIQSSLSCDPEFAPGYYQLGRLREKQGSLPEAVAALTSAIEKDGQTAESWLALARVYRRTGDGAGELRAMAGLARLHQNNVSNDAAALGKAIDAYRAVVQLDPASSDANYQLALLLTLHGSYREALSYAGKLTPAQQRRPQALAVRLVCHAALGDKNTKALVQAVADHKDLAERDVLDVLPALAGSKQDTISLTLLESLHARGLAGRAGLEALASAYERAGRFDEARKTLQELVSSTGVTPELLLQLARNAYKDADYKGSLEYLAHARAIDPMNAAIHFFFGMTAIAMDLPVEAKKSLGEAIQLEAGNAYYHYAYGAVLAQDRDASLSIPQFEMYCRLRPQDVRGRFALAVARFLSGQTESAQAAFTDLIRHPETSAGAHYFLGRIAKQENRLEDAERELSRSLELLPDELDARAELGQVYMRLGKYDLAEQQLARVLKQDRMHYLANFNLLALYQRTHRPEASEQAERLDQVKKVRSEKEQALWRTVEVRPY